MHNKPINSLAESESRGHLRLAPDEQPIIRLLGVLVLVTLPLGAIGARLVSVQTELTDEIVAEFHKTTESFEPIPSRDGRILGSDGQVLAHDIRRFHVKVHYRWLEDPPDEMWVKRQALRELSAKARRDPVVVERRVAEFLRQREKFWERLTKLTGLDPLEVTYRRQTVQTRIERIIRSVEANRDQRAVENLQELSRANEPHSHWWQRVWKQVRHELVTSPDRRGNEPIIIREELDYHRLLNDVSFDVAMHIETHPELYPGASIERATERQYPLDDLAAHAVGVRTPLRHEETDQLQQDGVGGLQAGDRVGRSGLEKQYNHVLRGRPGLRRVVRDRAGEIIETQVIEEPDTGEDPGHARELVARGGDESPSRR